MRGMKQYFKFIGESIVKNWFRLSILALFGILVIYLIGFYFPETKKLNEQQRLREYIAKRKLDCYNIEQQERKIYNNVDSSGYLEPSLGDVCFVRYTIKKYIGVNCEEKYKNNEAEKLNCEARVSIKEF